MDKLRPRRGQPQDRGRLKNRTEQTGIKVCPITRRNQHNLGQGAMMLCGWGAEAGAAQSSSGNAA